MAHTLNENKAVPQLYKIMLQNKSQISEHISSIYKTYPRQ